MNSKDSNKGLSEFLSKNYNSLLGYVSYLFRERYQAEEASDILQDVTETVLNKLNLGYVIEDFAGFFYRSLRNRAYDLLRKPQKNVNLDHVSLMEEEGEESFSLPSDPQQQIRLIQEIDKLNSLDQTIIYETEFNEITFAELSEQLNIPLGTLLSRKHRALKKLNQILTKENKEKVI